jgi:predicted  nucleic acid-binding Zn-ribbon protein
MEAMRESWTDQRLDEFAADTSRRFDGVDGRLDGVDKRLNGVDRRLNGVDRRLHKIEGRLDGVDKRLDLMEQSMSAGFNRIDTDMRELRSQNAAFQRTFLQVSGGAFVTFVVGLVGVITQL